VARGITVHCSLLRGPGRSPRLQWRKLWRFKQHSSLDCRNHCRNLCGCGNCNQRHGHDINDDPAIIAIGMTQSIQLQLCCMDRGPSQRKGPQFYLRSFAMSGVNKAGKLSLELFVARHASITGGTKSGALRAFAACQSRLARHLPAFSRSIPGQY
jgi:hypothetical protein